MSSIVVEVHEVVQLELRVRDVVEGQAWQSCSAVYAKPFWARKALVDEVRFLHNYS